ncbi:MAG: hypothetical protein H6599_04765 [Flavobacteriales bacterium]|nr:hypothetical protein [Flavobacteriales bacterium]
MSKIFFIIVIALNSPAFFSQDQWTHYDRTKIGISTEENIQKVAWIHLETTTLENKVEVLKTNKEIIAIENVLEEQLEKITFENFRMPLIMEILDIDFEYQENAKMDITCLSELRAPYLVGMEALAELKDGRMIFGGEDVVCIYDGYKMQVYNSTSDYYFKEIHSIFVDSQNRAWIGSDGGISYYENGKFYKPTNSEVGKVWNYRESSEGEIYAATYNQGIYILNEDFTTHIFKDGKIDEVLDFVQTGTGEILYGLDNGLAFKKEGQWFEYPFGEDIGSLRSLLRVNQRIYIGTFRDGVYFLEEGEIYQINAPDLVGKSSYNIQLVGNQVWIPFFPGGILVINDDLSFFKILHEDGLIGWNTIKICLDSFGNVWSTDLMYGISKIQDIKLKPIAEPIEGFAYIKRESFQDTTWYFGIHKSIYRKIGDEYSKLDFRGDDYLATADAISGDEAIFSNHERGIVIYKNNQIYHYATNEQKDLASFTRPTYGKGKDIYYTNYPEEVRRFYNDSVFNLSRLPDLEGRRVKQIEVNDLGIVCIRFDNSIGFFKDDAYALFHKGNGLLSNWTLSILPWGKGFCVITEKGVQLFEDAIIKKTYPFNILSEGRKCETKRIDENGIFIISGSDMLLLRLNDDEIIQEDLNYNKDSYLIRQNITITPDNEIQLRKEGSNYQLDLFQEIVAKVNSTLWIDSIMVNDKLVNMGNQVQLTQDDQVKIFLSAVSLRNKGWINYQLISNDKLVTKGTVLNRIIEFGHLTEGNYQLEIVHVDNDKKSNGFSLNVEVAPYWYQTIWFYVGLGLTIGLSFLMYVRYRFRKSLKYQHKLERQVAEKTIEVQKEKTIIEEQLIEKEILLKEVNHRVKNNMQMVRSVLELQKSKENNLENKEVIDKAITRVKTLALAHQNLYQNKFYNVVNLKEYTETIVKSLVKGLPLQVDLSIHGLEQVNIESAQALGMVLNELITNSIKHAWEKMSADSMIKISIEKKEGDLSEFTYHDNGEGFSTKDFDKDSLGVLLISAFVERRLEGSYTVSSKEGFNFKSEIKL